MSTRILVAVAWPYANGPRHVGHVAGFGVPSDVFARYHRLKGDEVLMVSGTDEHGTPIMIAAETAGVSPRELVDEMSAVIRRDLVDLGVSYDLFTRTTTGNHAEVVTDLFERLQTAGLIVEQTSQVAVRAGTDQTLPDRYIEGTCPICGTPGARGDQCDACGNQLDAKDLIDPVSRIDGQPPEFRDEPHLFLDLSALADDLSAWIGAQEHWRPNVRRFSAELARDLRPRPITRDLDWGVRVPVDDPRFDTKRIYVWFDAVIGYLSASIEWARLRGEPDAWRRWWMDGDARGYYFMGKDNITFHTVIWPGILTGVNRGPGTQPLNLPHDVVSTEFLTMEGKKFSSSTGVVIYVRDVLARYQPDALRYYLIAAGPESADSDFTWSEFVRRTNEELVSNWGNLVNRVLSMVAKNHGQVPAGSPATEADEAVLAATDAALEEIGEQLERARFKAALAAAMAASARVNGYLSDTEPWKLAKTDPDRAARVLRTAIDCVATLAVPFSVFLPFASARLETMLGFGAPLTAMPEAVTVERDGGTDEVLALSSDVQADAAWAPRRVAVGTPIAKPSVLFATIEPEAVDAELARMADAAAS